MDDMKRRQERGLTGHFIALSHGKGPATCELRNDETYRHVPLLSTNEPTIFLDPLFSLPLHTFQVTSILEERSIKTPGIIGPLQGKEQ
jgi:hypothetical protein